MKSFADVLAETQRVGPKKVAIAGAPNAELTEAFDRASGMGIAEPVVFDDATAAAIAVRDGQADVLMKGDVSSKEFMKAVLVREDDFRTGELISHLFVIECFGRLLIITDGGICIRPTLEQKAEIIRNTVPIAQRLGMTVPKVAVLAAVEKVNPKMPATVDADALSKMNIPGCEVQGPLALDLAVSPASAETKGVPGPVAGHADVLLMPDIESGNMLCKALMYFCEKGTGGLVSGTKRPVTFSSRADTADTKLHTIALGVLMSDPL